FYITYAFEALGEGIAPETLVEAAVIDITAPKAGESPDYSATEANNSYELKDENNRTTKNGITWKNETTGKEMVIGIDKFEAGNVYSVTVGVSPTDEFVFQTDSAYERDIDG
ncbi:MAG: hypothetical protein IKA89_01760, partial [Anaerotignum sp.]|nr:hypothetical protein [Anaerotignum sp.]